METAEEPNKAAAEEPDKAVAEEPVQLDAPAEGGRDPLTAPCAAPAVPTRSRLSKQSPGFGVFARAAAQAAADTPVLDDPYWLPPEPAPEVTLQEESTARERLRKVTILVLSEANAEEGMGLAAFQTTLEQLHQDAAADMNACSFSSVADMLKAETEVARLDAEAQRVFPVDLAEDEFAGEGPEGFQLRVDRSNGGELGLKVAPDEDQRALEILQVNPGLVKEWCQKRPSRNVVAGDRILAVNGRRGASRQLVALLRQNQPLVLLIQRKCHAKPRGGKAGGKGKGKGRTREALQARPSPWPRPTPKVPGASAKSQSRPSLRFMNGWSRNGARGRSRSERNRRTRGRREDTPKRPETRRPVPQPSPEELQERKELEMLSHIARGLVCGVCMGPLTGACGTLDLRKCGHRVHAECLIGAERDPSGHPRCQACATQAQLGQRFRDREAAAKRRAEPQKAPHKDREQSRKRSERRRRSRSSSGRGRRRSRRSRRRGRASPESSDSSSSRSDGDSSGEGSQNSSDSKPPGNLMAIRGSSRFCDQCGEHLGWVEKLTASTTQKVPESLCSKCQAKATAKAAEAKAAEAKAAEALQVLDAEVEEEGMEVDEWGFQMALDQVREASCAEDALAVLQALVESKPCTELLEAEDWSAKLQEVQGLPTADSRVVECAKRVACIWDRKKRGESVGGGPAEKEDAAALMQPAESAETSRPTSVASRSESAESQGLGWTCATSAVPFEETVAGASQNSEPASQETSTTDLGRLPASAPGEYGDVEQAVPLNANKGFLAGLLERARRKAKDKIVAAATALGAVGSENQAPATTAPQPVPVPKSPDAAPGQWAPVAPEILPLPPLLGHPPPFAWPPYAWPPTAPVPPQSGAPY